MKAIMKKSEFDADEGTKWFAYEAINCEGSINKILLLRKTIVITFSK